MENIDGTFEVSAQMCAVQEIFNCLVRINCFIIPQVILLLNFAVMPHFILYYICFLVSLS